MKPFTPQLYSSTAKLRLYHLSFWVSLLIAPAALGAQVSLRAADPDTIPFLTYCWLVVFALMGWAASDLPKMAGWVNGGLQARLEIFQGLIGAVLAGICVYFIGKSSPAMFGMDTVPPEMTLFVMVALAGFAGTKTLEWARAKFLK